MYCDPLPNLDKITKLLERAPCNFIVEMMRFGNIFVQIQLDEDKDWAESWNTCLKSFKINQQSVGINKECIESDLNRISLTIGLCDPSPYDQ